jgi:hypothetical protein
MTAVTATTIAVTSHDSIGKENIRMKQVRRPSDGNKG